MQTHSLSSGQIEQWQRDGYLLVSGLFEPAEIDELRAHFMRMREAALDETAPLRQFYQPKSEAESDDKLAQYPRVLHPHRFDERSMKQMLDARLGAVLRDLMGAEPIAAQSMFYFKPAGSRGQALHQDNFYLNVQPATCVAAWLAVDDADPENGGMNVVARSHEGGVLCPGMADMEQSFSTEEVGVPAGLEATPARMKAGDVLFFGGETIHGSTPNISQNRFRRAFICHYVPATTTAMNASYFPLRHFDGSFFDAQKLDGSFFDAQKLDGPLNTCGAEDWATYQKLRDGFMQNRAVTVD